MYYLMLFYTQGELSFHRWSSRNKVVSIIRVHYIVSFLLSDMVSPNSSFYYYTILPLFL